jgi:transposase-like protein
MTINTEMIKSMPQCCNQEIENATFDYHGEIRSQASAIQGQSWTCPKCGRRWVHECDEAEGCAWWPTSAEHPDAK